MLNWSSMSSPLATNEPGFSLAKVIRGDFDKYIRAFAETARQWGHPFFLRFNWEMNGNWFPWSETANGNHPGESAAAWRHVHDLFNVAGATNVTWVWCPNVATSTAKTNLGELYPGDAYVDWTCLDGYNWGTAHGPNGWNTFDQIFAASYAQIIGTIAPAKPMLIGEVASTEHGGSKASWITNMFQTLGAGYPAIHAVLWFDAAVSGMDWPVETSQTSTSAFARAIAAPTYATNTYANLNSAKIIAP
jgi:beta-mannanase